MKKQLTYIFLPAPESSIAFRDGILCFEKKHTTKFIEGNRSKPQHLYILSPDEIKDGDWIIGNEAPLATRTVTKYELPQCKNWNKFMFKKIIATTNLDLMIPDNINDGSGIVVDVISSRSLPYISQSDIEYIISLHNGKAKEVDNIENRKIVSAQQYALSKCGAGEMSSLTKVKLAWENGFETAQCLQDNADKKFTLDDMRNIMNIGMSLRQDQLNGYSSGSGEEKLQEYIQSLTKEKSKSDSVMVEYDGNIHDEVYRGIKPKLKDGCIVIVRN